MELLFVTDKYWLFQTAFGVPVGVDRTIENGRYEGYIQAIAKAREETTCGQPTKTQDNIYHCLVCTTPHIPSNHWYSIIWTLTLNTMT